MEYAWIDRMDAEQRWWFSVQLACELLEVSRSGFYDWRARQTRPATAAEREQQLLVAAITVEHIASRPAWLTADPCQACRQGWPIGVNRAARLMALHGLEGRSGRRRASLR